VRDIKRLKTAIGAAFIPGLGNINNALAVPAGPKYDEYGEAVILARNPVPRPTYYLTAT